MAVRSLRYNTFEGRSWKGATFATDADALAFLEAAQVYDRNQQKAIVDLVRRLKTAGLWSKMKAIYPFVGGTASSHKWNLKDPRDVDAAFRLSFSGGWTHSATGILGNGTNSFADTFFSSNVNASNSDAHISIYIRTNNTANQYDWGGSLQSPDSYTYLLQFTSSIFVRDYRWCDAVSRIGRVNNPTRTDGMFTLTANSSSQTKGYRNSTTEVTTNATAANSNTQNIVIGAQRLNNNISGYSSREYAFFTAGSKLTDTDATNLYTIVDLYQKRLSRAV